MTHHHGHDHDGHTHDHDHGHHHHDLSGDDLIATDLSISDSDLNPTQAGRRNFLRAAGVLGAGAAIAPLVDTNAAATAAVDVHSRGNGRHGRVTWLAGDHHIHTQFSSDGLYRVFDQARHADAYGLDWIVITDHSSNAHVKIGADKVNPEIRDARRRLDDLLIFQGLEWNIPGAEHGTVFVHPGRNELSVLKTFEADYDGSLNGATGNSPANEELAKKGLTFLAKSVSDRRVQDALFLANHPARRGIDSPHEVRGWRDAAPKIAVGWEGAPGHQAAGIPKAQLGPGGARGAYGNSPSADSFPGYVAESYRTWGGFDYYSATVGGLWDSLLAEGKPWWISANSDSHSNYLDTAVRGAGSDFNTNGQYNDPEYSGAPNTNAADFWPGFYSRTHVGARGDDYASVMAGIRSGNVWVDHGGLLESLDVRVSTRGNSAGLGGIITARRGERATLTVTIVPAQLPNWATFVPKLAKVDIIKGLVTGPAADRDTLSTPHTRVVRSYDVTGKTDTIKITYDLGRVEDKGFYVRLRGSDGKRTQTGYFGAAIDPAGPALDVVGDADPWKDLWFYTNPIFVLPRK